MKKNKAFASLLLAIALLAPTVALTACDNEDEPSDSPTVEAPVSPPENENLGNDTDNEQTDAPVVLPTVQKADYIRCTGNSVNLRAGAGTSYTVAGTANKGEIYAVVEKTGAWYKTYYRGKTVYLSASYAAVLSLDKSEDTQVENVLNEGYKLLGVPYVYGAVRLHDGKGKMLGGFTAQKFDCSSLVQYVFYKGAGKILQVNTRTQVTQGAYVPKSQLQRGDCIYFTNESRQHLSGVERVGHVAIYLGDNYILHTASDYARIEKMTASRWNFYIEARRFI
ncbi:MAG: C40 family peptidase [Clostridia bacterium]|nr:C40 family peptidase [Clostridia bacterium]